MKKHLFRQGRHLLAALLFAFSPGLSQAQGGGITADAPQGDGICPLSALDLTKVTCFDDAGKTKVRANLTTLGNPIVLRDTTYTCGVGTHAPSKAVVAVNGATRFTARLGVDDEASSAANHGIVDYTVSVFSNRQETVVMTGRVNRTDGFTIPVDVDLTGADYLVLNLENAGQAWADQVSWANAVFHYAGEAPATVLESDMYRDGSKVQDIPEAEEGLENIPLSSLEIGKATCGWGTIKADRSIDGNAIILRDTTYTSGVGTHAPSQIIVKLNGSVTRFVTRVGVDDEVLPQAQGNANYGNCNYRVSLKAENGDVRVAAEGTIKATDRTTPLIDIDVNGWKYLILEAENGVGGNSCDHVDWAGAYLVFEDQNSTRPIIVSAEELSSKLASPVTVFSQPGVRFMHKLRAANPEAAVSVSDLPEGLVWNAARQLVEGKVEQEGVYRYVAYTTFEGETSKDTVTFTVSSQLEHPVPFMGWLSWNAVQSEVSEAIVKQVADLFEEKGLYECGWNTVMMDDWWHADSRAADGKPQPNPTRFPNGVKAVADYVHAKGMKFGLYTDAAGRTCAGAFGSYGYEDVDARQYAEWGVDVVKCDYCNAPGDVETAKTRYKALGDAFKRSGRNILLYICEWGVREPWKWGAEVGGACWRISQDVRDCWIGRGSGVGVVQSIAAMKDLAAWQGVNRFNDADMLCTGLHGTGKSSNDLCLTGPGMTMDEYRTQFALWCLWSSPMALSFDPRRTLSDEDLAIISNKEMIALNQDKMGQQADFLFEENNIQVYAKDLENGDVAVAAVNLGDADADFTFDFGRIPALDAQATYTCRDVWAQSACADAKGSLPTRVRSHATQVFRLSRKGSASGIASPLSAEGFKVKAAGGKVTVTCPGTEGQSKRIIVSDMDGRVVAARTAAGERVNISLSAPRGAYAVSVACGAQATSRKVLF